MTIRPARRVAERPRQILEVGSDRSAARAREDYVKAIYQLGERVKAADLARRLSVTPVSVHKAKLALQRDGLLVADPETNELSLTGSGRRLAVAMVRRHRLIEAFLHNVLAVPLERVHGEAERIEHAISDDIAERLARHMGYPERDPHGHLIPYGTRHVPDPQLPTLATVAATTDIRVVSIDDHDAEAVRALAQAGILPGLHATATPTADGAVRLTWGAIDVVVTGSRATKVRVAEMRRPPERDFPVT